MDEDGNEVEIDPRPMDLRGLVDAAVAQGDMTRPAAALAALEGALGVADATPGLDVESAQTDHITSLLVDVQEMVDAGEFSDAELDRVRTALGFVHAPQDRLDQVSSPESELTAAPETTVRSGTGNRPPLAVTSGQLLAQVMAQDLSACQQLAVDGFGMADDAFAAVAGVPCYVYREARVGQLTQRVYYPSAWLDDTEKQALVAAVMEALLDAQVEYSTHDGLTIGAVNLILDLPQANRVVGASADPNFALGDPTAPCTVWGYHGLQARFESQILEPSMARFLVQHVVGHEVFHCTQFRSFGRRSADTWWREGTAEYFGLLAIPTPGDLGPRSVYPKFAFQHYNARSLEHPLWADELHYKNWVFFLYFAEQRGVAALIDLMDKVKNGADPPAALRSVDGMSELWNDFVRDFVAEEIMDPYGHGPIEVGIDFLDAEVDGDVVRMPEVRPFVATRYRLPFPERFAYRLSAPLDELDVQSVEMPRRKSLSSWTDRLEAVIACTSDDVAHVYDVTTVTDPAVNARFDVEAVLCGCPVSEEEASQAMERQFLWHINETGTVETEVPLNPAILGGCIFYADHGEASGLGEVPRATPVRWGPQAQGSTERGETQLAISLLRPNLLSVDDLEEQAAGSSDAVADFPGAALYYDDTLPVEDRTRPWSNDKWQLDVAIGPIVHRIHVRGLMMQDEGPAGVLARLRALVSVIEQNHAEAFANRDAADDPADDDPNAPGTGEPGGGDGGADGGGEGGVGGGDSMFGPAATATVEAEGQTFTFTTVFACDISPGAINAHFAVDAAGQDGGIVKADSSSGVIWVQTMSPLESREGYRVELSMSDPALEVTAGSFTFTAPATFHEDARSGNDPGRPAGDAEVTMTC